MATILSPAFAIKSFQRHSCIPNRQNILLEKDDPSFELCWNILEAMPVLCYCVSDLLRKKELPLQMSLDLYFRMLLQPSSHACQCIFCVIIDTINLGTPTK